MKNGKKNLKISDNIVLLLLLLFFFFLRLRIIWVLKPKGLRYPSRSSRVFLLGG